MSSNNPIRSRRPKTSPEKSQDHEYAKIDESEKSRRFAILIYNHLNNPFFTNYFC